MPPIVAGSIISFLRHCAYTEEYGQHTDYRHPSRIIRNHKSSPQWDKNTPMRSNELARGPGIEWLSHRNDTPLRMSPGVQRGGCNRIPLLSSRRLCILSCGVGLRSGPPLFTLLSLGNKEDDQWPGQPQPSLRSASASRSTGICRPNSDSDPSGRSLTALVFCWPTCRLAWAGDVRVRPANSAAVKRGFSFHRCGHAQVVECAELPAWLLPDERHRRSSSRIARLRLGAPSETTYIRSYVPFIERLRCLTAARASGDGSR